MPIQIIFVICAMFAGQILAQELEGTTLSPPEGDNRTPPIGPDDRTGEPHPDDRTPPPQGTVAPGGAGKMTSPSTNGGEQPEQPEQPQPDGTPNPDDETKKGKHWRQRIAQWKERIGKIQGQQRDKAQENRMPKLPKDEEKDKTEQRHGRKRPGKQQGRGRPSRRF